MGSVATEQADFLSLVREMRALGATRVRCGHMEVAFAAPPEAQQGVPVPGPMQRVDVVGSERAELAELRDKARRAEELGIEL